MLNIDTRMLTMKLSLINNMARKVFENFILVFTFHSITKQSLLHVKL
jgi:hypothetical protein